LAIPLGFQRPRA